MTQPRSMPTLSRSKARTIEAAKARPPRAIPWGRGEPYPIPKQPFLESAQRLAMSGAAYATNAAIRHSTARLYSRAAPIAAVSR